ncbi:MAG TPA: zinc ABC transporter substrate-binding protein [Patescibacteria group bacterium]|nr:zinc ABC transporter substrate-binding protein [Patescibacteria group bacterium]
MSTRKKFSIGFGIVIFMIAAAILFYPRSNSASHNGTLQVVAGENFWGSLAAQIGGTHAEVTSIVSDPNADPHEYENSNANARDFATADYVILNGAGYDSWGNKLLSANVRPNREVLIVADALGKKDGDNPHFWYSPTYVNTVASKIAAQYASLDPKDTDYFTHRLAAVQSSLAGYQTRIAAIKQAYGGTQVAATEDIFQYLADAAGLTLTSPQAFIQAVAEGNDPPTDSVAAFHEQLKSGSVRILVFNKQTVTPLTENIKKLATDQHIPIIGVTETIQPPNTSFQDWMDGQVSALKNALDAQKTSQ